MTLNCHTVCVLSALSRVFTVIKLRRSNGSRKIIGKNYQTKSENDWSWRTMRWALSNINLPLHLQCYKICYSADDLLPLCEELGVPLVVSTPPIQLPQWRLK